MLIPRHLKYLFIAGISQYTISSIRGENKAQFLSSSHVKTNGGGMYMNACDDRHVWWEAQ